jgi:hypothetical protein
MSETTNPKNVKDDEIDLLDLFRRMGKAIGKMSRAIGRALLISIIFLLKRWLPLLASVILGIGAAYLIKLTSASFYTSDLILRANSVSTTSDMISYINRLHLFCKENNRTALSEAISLKPEQVENVIDISAYWIIDNGNDGVPDLVDYRNKHNVYDTINVRMQDRLDVSVTTKFPLELQYVKDGILSFINADSLFQQRNRVRLRQNQELLARLNYDILQLDSLQKVIIEETARRQPQAGGQMIFLQEQKTQLVYQDIYSLHSRKLTLELERDLYKDIVTILSEFSIPAKRINGAGFYAIKIVPLFFCITLLILLVIANRKKLEEIYHKY